MERRCRFSLAVVPFSQHFSTDKVPVLEPFSLTIMSAFTTKLNWFSSRQNWLCADTFKLPIKKPEEKVMTGRTGGRRNGAAAWEKN